MSKIKVWFYGSLAVTLLVLFLLITGSSILIISLVDNANVPLGTFLTWIGVIALPLTIYWGIEEFRSPTNPFYRLLAIALKTIIALAILWIPIAYLLAGNISFTFTEKETFQGGQSAMKWFWRISYSTVLAPVLLLITYWISRLLISDEHKTQL